MSQFLILMCLFVTTVARARSIGISIDSWKDLLGNAPFFIKSAPWGCHAAVPNVLSQTTLLTENKRT